MIWQGLLDCFSSLFFFFYFSNRTFLSFAYNIFLQLKNAIVEYVPNRIHLAWMNQWRRKKKKRNKRFSYSAAGSVIHTMRLAIQNSMPHTANKHKSQQWQLNKLWAFRYGCGAHWMYWTLNTPSVIQRTNNITFESFKLQASSSVFFCRMMGLIRHRSEMRSEHKQNMN